MEQIASLTEELAALKTGFKQRAAPERLAMMEAATADLRATGIEARALKMGSKVPDLTLPDALNQTVRLSALWQRGPLVLIFYRGGWCPYCNLELRAWQQQLPALKHMGAQLVAVSPQTPDNSLSTAQKNELAFPVLSDSALQAATAFGVAFEMPPALVELLPAYRSIELGVYAVYPSRKFVAPKVRLLIDFLADSFRMQAWPG